MATKDKTLEKYLGGEGILFQDNASGGLNLDKLSNKQAVTLARQGRSESAGGGSTGSQRIMGSSSNTERAILGAAGKELASGSTLVVPNVQRSRAMRMDERSGGGVKATPRGSTTTRSPGIAPIALGLAGMTGRGSNQGLINLAKKAIAKGIKQFKGSDEKFVDTSPTRLDLSPIRPGIDTYSGPAGSEFSGQSLDPSQIPEYSGQSFEPPEFGQSMGKPATYNVPTSAMPGVTHAATLANAGISTATTSAAAGMGEGALNIAAAQSLAQQAGVSAAGSAGGAGAGGAGAAAGLGTTLGTTAGLAGMAYIAGQILQSKALFGGRTKPKSYSPEQLLNIAEGKTTQDEFGKINIIEEDGKRYVQDPYAAKNYGQNIYHPLDDTSYLDQKRTQMFKNKSKLTMDRGEREEYSARSGDLNNQYVTSGRSTDEINTRARGIKTNYEKYKTELNDPEYTGLG